MQRISFVKTIGGGLLAACLAVAMAACLPDQVAWSPDGRNLAYIRPSDNSLWVWDGATRKSKRIATPMSREAGFCMFMPHGEMEGQLLVATAHPSSSPGKPPDAHTCADLHRFDAATGKLVEANIDFEVFLYGGYALSGDGRRFYYVTSREAEKSAKGDQIERLYELDLTKKDQAPRQIYMIEEGGFVCPGPNADGSKILLASDKKISVLDKASGKVESLLTLPEKTQPVFPIWIDGERSIAYLQYDDDQKGDLTPLIVYSLQDKSSRTVVQGVYHKQQPTLSPDGKSILATMVKVEPSKTLGKIEEFAPAKIQVGSVDLATGKVTWLTDEPLGAGHARLDPSGKKLAYLSPITGGAGSKPTIHVLDLETKTSFPLSGDDAR